MQLSSGKKISHHLNICFLLSESRLSEALGLKSRSCSVMINGGGGGKGGKEREGKEGEDGSSHRG